MADFYNQIYRSDWQKRHFQVKFRDDLRREICVKYAMGETTAEIHAWVIETKRIPCSYNAIRHYLIAKRWRRFISMIVVSDIDDPVFHRMLQRIMDERRVKWDALAKTFSESLQLAVSKNPLEVQDFAKLIKILRQLKRLPMGCRRQIRTDGEVKG